MAQIQVRFLGTPTYTVDEQPVTLKAGKASALLAYLALSGTGQSRAALASLLWAYSDATAARKNLRNHLWQIRQALGDEALIIEDERIGLAPHVITDVAAFSAALNRLLVQPEAEVQAEALAKSLSLWRGTLLESVRVPEAPDFDLWLLGERERLERLYFQGAARLIDIYRSSQDWSAIVQFARSVLAFDGAQEATAAALMEAHARLEDKPRALHTYEALRASLNHELAVEPLTETDALYRAILHDELTPHQTKTVPVRPEPLRQPGVDDAPPFVGRAVELAFLQDAYLAAQGGRLQLVTITGELGIGKSELVHHWLRQIADVEVGGDPDAVVITTTCLNTTQPVPFAPLVRLLRRHQDAPFFGSLPAHWQSELIRLVPDLSVAGFERHAPAALQPGEEPLHLFEAMAELLLAVHARPLVLFLDDLHWVDPSTLNWLTYLLDRLADTPLMIVAAYRPQDADETLLPAVAHWARLGHGAQLTLPRFTPVESRYLLQQLGVDPSQADALHAHSGGNPYMLVELSRGEPGATPTELTAILASQVARLSDSAQQLLHAAAILEPDIDFVPLQRTAKRSEEEAVDAVDELLSASILREVEREVGERYEFDQPLLAMVVRDGLSKTRRRFLHRRAADSLLIAQADGLDAVAGQLARHFAGAGVPAQAAKYAEMAGRHAFGLGAMVEALAYFQRAYGYESTPARLLEMGRSRTYVPGRLEEGRTQMIEAIEQAAAADDRDGAADGALKLAFSYVFSDDTGSIIHWAEYALALLDEEKSSSSVICGVHFVLGSGLARRGELVAAEAHLVQACDLAMAHDLTHLPAILSWAERGMLLLRRGMIAEARRLLQRSLACARVAGDVYHETLVFNQLAYAAYVDGDLDEAEAHVAAGLKLADSYSVNRPRQVLYSTHGEIALAQNNLDAAAARFSQALIEAERYGNLMLAANIRANLGRVAQAQQQFDDAVRLMTDARTAVRESPDADIACQIDLWLAALHLARGETAEAEAIFLPVEALLAQDDRALLQQQARQIRVRLDAL